MSTQLDTSNDTLQQKNKESSGFSGVHFSAKLLEAEVIVTLVTLGDT